uniref:Ribosomal protein L16 n=1 Tax=Porphyra umbilicalis TaxID=2786 RepID=J3RK05_PORUM|nr:ribosomal protein L16 [Porphyra umbilicalis]AFC17794.1 ribosomal protein L16 [Porphyra umbilicalis]
MKRFNLKNNPTRQYKQIKKNVNQTNHILKRGYVGLRSLEQVQVDVSQINSLKQFLQKELKIIEKKTDQGKIKLWFYMLPNRAVTKLSPETRMGKGKGPIVSYCCYIEQGQLLFEIANLPEVKTLEVVSKVRNFISFKAQLLSRFS